MSSSSTVVFCNRRYAECSANKGTCSTINFLKLFMMGAVGGFCWLGLITYVVPFC